MGLAVVLGALLRVETIGYDGPDPMLLRAPIKIDRDPDGKTTYHYDLTPPEENLTVEDVCARLGSRLERLFDPQSAAMPDGPYGRRATLEFGVLADREDESFAYAWPMDFLRVLVDADINLNVSHYLPTPAKGAED